MTRSFDRYLFKTLFVTVLALVIGGSALQHYYKTQKLSRLGTQTKTAFLRWRTQILGDETPGRGAIPGLMKGDDVYKLYNYPNPPIQPLILWPFAELPAAVGAMLWFALKVGMAALSFLWAFRLVGPIPDWIKAVAILLSLHPILGDLSHGNVNLFIAFLVFGGIEAYRRGWFWIAGLVFALAIACKITPALFLPYFGWKWLVLSWRNRRLDWTHPQLFTAMIAGLALWLFVVPGAILGWSHNQTLLTSWFEGMAQPFLIEGKVTSEHHNQSIPGVVVRLLTNQPSVVEYDDEDKPYGAEFHNLTDIGPENARWILRGCQFLFVLAMAILCRSSVRSGLKPAAEMAFVLLGMLLFSERTWKHHAVTLLLPFTVLLAFAYGHRWMWIPIGLATAFMTIPSAFPEKSQDLALTYGTHTIAFLVLLVGVGAVLGKRESNAADAISVQS